MVMVMVKYTRPSVRFEPRPGFVVRGDARGAMAPGRANGLYVVVVGDGECYFGPSESSVRARPCVRLFYIPITRKIPLIPRNG